MSDIPGFPIDLPGGYQIEAYTDEEADIFVGRLYLRHEVDMDFRVPFDGHEPEDITAALLAMRARFPGGWAAGYGPEANK